MFLWQSSKRQRWGCAVWGVQGLSKTRTTHCMQSKRLHIEQLALWNLHEPEPDLQVVQWSLFEINWIQKQYSKFIWAAPRTPDFGWKASQLQTLWSWLNGAVSLTMQRLQRCEMPAFASQVWWGHCSWSNISCRAWSATCVGWWGLDKINIACRAGLLPFLKYSYDFRSRWNMIIDAGQQRLNDDWSTKLWDVWCADCDYADDAIEGKLSRRAWLAWMQHRY